MCSWSLVDADIFAGQQLRKLRKARGFSQVAMASVLGVSFQQIQKYERGRNRISVGRIDSIARFFNVSVLYFFCVSHEEREFHQNFIKCNHERKNILLALAQTYSVEGVEAKDGDGELDNEPSN